MHAQPVKDFAGRNEFLAILFGGENVTVINIFNALEIQCLSGLMPFELVGHVPGYGIDVGGHAAAGRCVNLNGCLDQEQGQQFHMMGTLEKKDQLILEPGQGCVQ